jgi:hypothetical protein
MVKNNKLKEFWHNIQWFPLSVALAFLLVPWFIWNFWVGLACVSFFCFVDAIAA